MTLAGRHALVTGAGSGIGAAVACALAAAGARVSLAGRRPAPLWTVAASIGDAAIAEIDVTVAQSIAAGVDAVRAAAGPIDILVNNAGRAVSRKFAATDPVLWAEMLAVNLTGTFLVTQAVLPDMQAGTFGRIINIASTAGLVGYQYVAAYVAAKHGVVGLTRALALELARTGITVNAVCPGYTDTPMIDAAVAGIAAKSGRTAEEALDALTRSNPQGRLVTPQEVADCVVWLASPGASSVTGQAISVSGGEVMAG